MESWYKSATYFQDLNALSTLDYRDLLAGGEEAELPPYLADWLGRLRLFYGMPFEYLVPDERLLPPESIRFFYVDRNWSDRMVDGALSVGKTHSREYSHHHAVYNTVAAVLDNEERRIRPRLRTGEADIGQGEAADMTGFLLRSQAAAFYPGLEVKAYRGEESDKTDLRLLRMDRLGPDILLCLFDGVPDIVDVEEPREGIQFGVDINLDGNGHIEGTADNPSGFTLKIRHIEGPHSGYEVGWIDRDISDDPIDGIPDKYDVSVPVRAANPQVLHIEALRTAVDDVMDAIKADHGGQFVYDGYVGPAELSVQMLQFPFHQRFHGDGRPRPLDTMPVFELKTQYTAATVGVQTAIAPLSDAERRALATGGGEEA